MNEADASQGAVFRLRAASVASLLRLLAIGVCGFALWTGVKYAFGLPFVPVEFDIFHLAGRVAWDGRIAEAYGFEAFVGMQDALGNGLATMAWSYPPPFDLVVAALAPLPVWLAYLLFVGSTLAAVLLVLRRLAGDAFSAVLICMLPVLAINVFVGQNGGLTGALAGLFLLLSLRGHRWAGVPLGLMVVKPHLALGLGAYLLLARRWGSLGQAAAVAAAMAGLSTLAFGPEVWAAFLEGVRESGALLRSGAYPLYRMTSVYAGLRSFGVDTGIALGVHAGVALAAVAMVQVALVRGWRTERVLAVATMATLLASPYNYDYDLPILGLALALAFRNPLVATSRRLVLAVVALALFAGLYPTAAFYVPEGSLVLAWLTRGDSIVSLAPFALLVLLALLLGSMWREERVEVAGAARLIPS